jgi:hypothetical protein
MGWFFYLLLLFSFFFLFFTSVPFLGLIFCGCLMWIHVRCKYQLFVPLVTYFHPDFLFYVNQEQRSTVHKERENVKWNKEKMQTKTKRRQNGTLIRLESNQNHNPDPDPDPRHTHH